MGSTWLQACCAPLLHKRFCKIQGQEQELKNLYTPCDNTTSQVQSWSHIIVLLLVTLLKLTLKQLAHVKKKAIHYYKSMIFMLVASWLK
jgi:hypothetical protein